MDYAPGSMPGDQDIVKGKQAQSLLSWRENMTETNKYVIAKCGKDSEKQEVSGECNRWSD